eukprot:2143233-Prymnesium_polylepis.1
MVRSAARESPGAAARHGEGCRRRRSRRRVHAASVTRASENEAHGPHCCKQEAVTPRFLLLGGVEEL